MTTASEASPQPGTSLKELRRQLSAAERKALGACLNQIERELIDAWPELRDSIQTASRQGSFSSTIQLKHKKNDHFQATISVRVRAPREPHVLDMHLDDDGQLVLGLPKGYDGGNGSTEGNGRDDDGGHWSEDD